MPNNAPIVINDGTSDITFSPDSSSNTHVVLQNKAVGVIAQRELVHFDRSASESTTIRRSIRVNVPKVYTDSQGVETTKIVSYKIEEVADRETDQAHRGRAKALAEGALASAQADAVFVDPEWFW